MLFSVKAVGLDDAWVVNGYLHQEKGQELGRTGPTAWGRGPVGWSLVGCYWLLGEWSLLWCPEWWATQGQRRHQGGSASAVAPPRWRVVGACRAVGEGRALEERKWDPGKRHQLGTGSREGILGLGQGQTGVRTYNMQLDIDYTPDVSLYKCYMSELLTT